MKSLSIITAILLLFFSFEKAAAQLIANAGNDTTVCSGVPVILGGNPTASGGTPPYNYEWNNSDVSENTFIAPITNITMYVTVTDGLGATAVDSVIITVNPNPVIDSIATTDVSCYGGNNGSACANVSGGTPPYNYLWSSGSTGQCWYGNALNYTFLITDANGCAVSDTATINEPAPLVIDSIVTTDVTCFGERDGSACVYASGGTLPYSYYSWSNGAITQCINDLGAGNYGVTLVDANGCTSNPSYTTINEPPQLQIDSIVTTDVTCFLGSDGIINIIVSGGAGTLEYTINGFTFQQTGIFSNLPAGTYWVAVRDTNNCNAFTQVTISQPLPVNVQLTSATGGVYPDTLCVAVSNGVPPYTYNYSGNVNPLPNSCFELLSGTFEVTVTDANGCTTVNSSNCAGFKIDSLLTTDALCYGSLGSVCANISGGQLPYVYSWQNGANTQCTDFEAGTWSIIVSDANNCTVQESFTINEPAPLVMDSFYSEGVSCYGMSNGGICVFVQSPLLCYWGTGGISGNCPGNLAAGTYSFVLTDSMGCSSDSISIVVTEPAPIVVDSIITTDVTCNGANNGSACIYVSGGTPGSGFSPGYMFGWMTGYTEQDYFSCHQNNLSAGNYGITISDANGCIAVEAITINEPAPLVIDNIVTTDVSCYGGNDGSICVYISGGSIATYLWSNGISGSSPPMMGGLCIENLDSGPYGVAVTDVNGCSVTSNTITVSDAPQNVPCVWPGDTDNDGIADNNDLLPIGLAYGSAGIARTQQDIQWYAHPALYWADTLALGVNYRHIDCNGDGIVNSADTLAIIQNFGLTHLKNNQSKPWRMSAPALYVDLIPDTVLAGETLVANLILGDINIPAEDVYGLAFTINYDANVVDSAQTTVVFGSSWLGTVSEKISIAKDLPQNGEIKCAVTRIDKNTRSGLGIIGQASFIITTDNINGKNELAYHGMKVWISDLTVIDNMGQILEVNEGSDSTQVAFEPLSVKEKALSLNELAIQPNPAQNEVLISVSNNLLSGALTLIDTEGKVLFSKTITTHANKIHTTGFANGVYFVKIIDEKGVLTKRLVIVK